jgi:hypothetical protein
MQTSCAEGDLENADADFCLWIMVCKVLILKKEGNPQSHYLFP